MTNNGFIEPILKNYSFNDLINSINLNKKNILTSGVLSAQKNHLIYSVSQVTNKFTVTITQNEQKAKQIFDDLHVFLKSEVTHYPSKDILFYNADVKSKEILKERFKIINRILNNEPTHIVLSVESLFDKLVSKDVFSKFNITLKVSDTLDIEKLTNNLISMGYERTEEIEGQGQFAIRGGIIDIFVPTINNAIRIELWDNEIDSIRMLDTDCKRSIDKVDIINITPMRELVYSQLELDFAIKNLKNQISENTEEKLKNQTLELIEKLETEKTFSGIDKYIQFFYEKTYSLLDYLPKDTILFFDEPNKIRENVETILKEFESNISNKISNGDMLPSLFNMVYRYDDILKFTENFTKIHLINLTQNIKDFKIDSTINFNCKNSIVLKGNIKLLFNDLKNYISEKYTIVFMGGPRIRCERFEKEFHYNNIPVAFLDNLEGKVLKQGLVYIIRGSISNGFEYIDSKFIVISNKDIFGIDKNSKKVKKKTKGGKIENFSDLKVGDYVVHDNHGVGIFRGIEKIITDDVNRDYMKIGYANEGNLYVAINQMDMVQKYIGVKEPKINKLGNKQWSNSKAKAKKAVMALAKDLIKLYAKRQMAKGYVYSKDTIWQKEFEDSFPYIETGDQLNAIEDVKADMESEKVMDRLICGDVGFGKTEVAIRCAFKAIQDGKQVAFLVPTTILANQHYSTFFSRMKDYPIKIDFLSRFKTPKGQKEVIEKLEKGKIDILIGTHRILSKDLKFKDLGLLIIDEEQRFGVTHKEKLKNITKNIDVLTLSATPIPRTLHMSMTGIRDMSVLEEPPNERLPIQTYVMEYDEYSIKSAINRELARGGQIYYLHNRVNNISNETLKIQNLVPNARVSFAHGQMSERELENVMINFLDGEIDVLICTTIIETGLDIPNVNTIIIQDADKMGLSQLYQLRGRVGRSNKTSFAYLMYKKDKVLKEISEKRLQTIRDFTEFGSGFKIAMRDLEIRGAGNLLGSEQHGNMDLVGYEMYCKLLDIAVRQLKGEVIEEEFETSINVSLNAFIPPRYIKNTEQKLEMYKKIANIKNQEDFYDVQDELLDRFGELPKAVQNLLDIALMKCFAKKIGVISIIQKELNINIEFKKDASVNMDNIMKAVLAKDSRLKFNGILTYSLKDGEKDFIIKLSELFANFS